MKEKSNKIYFFREQSPHVQQIKTGFNLLRNQGLIDFTIKYISYDPIFPSEHLVIAIIGSKKIVYDMLDGYNLNIETLENFLPYVDFYFKRSYSKEKNSHIKGSEKIFPLGLNYLVESPSFPNILKNIRYYIFNKIGLRRELVMFPQDISQNPVYKSNGLKILFITRLWDPDEVTDKTLRTERIKINNDRISLCRAIRKKYPNSITGLMDSPLTRALAEDLILSQINTRRDNYLKLMKTVDICIATNGLHNSIGWRFAEYVAASKAIISEKIFYEIPYGFKSPENYVEFSDVATCLDIIDNMIEHPDIVNQMKRSNYNYYNCFLRPDMLVLNSLKVSFPR